jgi:hypothetical protein
MNVTTLMKLAQMVMDKEAEFHKLVRFVHLYGAYVRKWMRHIEEDTEYPDFHPVQAAWEALSPETRKAIDEVE